MRTTSNKTNIKPDSPTRDRIQTRSQTAKCKKTIGKSDKENDLPDKENDIKRKNKDRETEEKDNREGETETEEDNEQDEINKNLKLKKKKSFVIENETAKNIIDSRELLFLRKDHVAYFVDIHGNPLDAGSQKFFERNETRTLALGKVKAIKYKSYYHMALPICEEQREGPTLTLSILH